MDETPLPSEASLSRHLLPVSATEENGRLAIGGVDLCEIADEYGTPVFVYDERELRERCAEAVAAFGTEVAYGTKAFLCMSMARLAVEEGMRLDVSTLGELEIALHAGVAPDRLILHGNNKSDAEIERALSLGLHRIIVDSFDEIARLKSHRALVGAAPQRVLVRVTPGVEAHTHEYVMTGQQDSKFGFSLSSGDADIAIKELARVRGIEVVGVHAHIGSQIFELEAYEQSIRKLVPFLDRYSLGELCVGGGLGVAYLNSEAAPTISEWGKLVHECCHAAGVPSEIVISAEPGRSIVARASITCYRVGTIKEVAGVRTYLAVDGGMSDNPRPVLYGSGYEAFLPRVVDAERPRAFRIVGKHCESGDTLVFDARLPDDVAVGDVLATPVTGAYGMSMASNYNRLYRPPALFVRDGDVRTVIRRETLEDLIRLEL